MNGPRYVVDCSTGKTTLVELTQEEKDQREIDRVVFAAEEAERAEKDAYEKLIQDELRKMAEEGLASN